ncbi:hypothetical protein [Candidatus Leptofilum sp.]
MGWWQDYSFQLKEAHMGETAVGSVLEAVDMYAEFVYAKPYS